MYVQTHGQPAPQRDGLPTRTPLVSSGVLRTQKRSS
ncbi:hypothetical protein FHS42_001782 [Streptomyces zagrosensis]|uniref:Uncharacterized protein n=1 Tax=Streptomyces zagrosensis TaxID=1042984 RepID=A0A7W9Q713_9ACTN|nr:hypothetical protein [Streptomyces zagrosensis]